jgi:putative acetyltransferase
VNEALKIVVRAFQTEVQRGWALFRQYKGSAVTELGQGHSGHFGGWFRMRARVDSVGYLDADRRHRYSFHGIGLRVQLAPKLHIDWDIGHGGRMDGFDDWRLRKFLAERPELQRILPLDSLDEVLGAAVRDGSIVSPWSAQGDSLCYIADDLGTRPYAAEDLPALVAVFTASVHELAARYYTPQQLDAWAPQPPELAPWRDRLQSLETIVATHGEDLTGFISYTPDGHIELLYTSPAYARRGVASLLYSCVERRLASLDAIYIFTEASLMARPFFERFGFAVTGEDTVLLRDHAFRRYTMRKRAPRAT